MGSYQFDATIKKPRCAPNMSAVLSFPMFVERTLCTEFIRAFATNEFALHMLLMIVFPGWLSIRKRFGAKFTAPHADSSNENCFAKIRTIPYWPAVENCLKCHAPSTQSQNNDEFWRHQYIEISGRRSSNVFISLLPTVKSSRESISQHLKYSSSPLTPKQWTCSITHVTAAATITIVWCSGGGGDKMIHNLVAGETFIFCSENTFDKALADRTFEYFLLWKISVNRHFRIVATRAQNVIIRGCWANHRTKAAVDRMKRDFDWTPTATSFVAINIKHQRKRK